MSRPEFLPPHSTWTRHQHPAGELVVTSIHREGDEDLRYAVYLDGTYVGDMIYTSRKAKVGTEYGYRPAKATRQRSLSNRLDAAYAVVAAHPSLSAGVG